MDAIPYTESPDLNAPTMALFDALMNLSTSSCYTKDIPRVSSEHRGRLRDKSYKPYYTGSENVDRSLERMRKQVEAKEKANGTDAEPDGDVEKTTNLMDWALEASAKIRVVQRRGVESRDGALSRVRRINEKAEERIRKARIRIDSEGNPIVKPQRRGGGSKRTAKK